MTEDNGPALVYQTQADAYDALIRAEDHDRLLENHLLETYDFQGKHVADIGAGTGRLSRWIAPLAKHIHLSDVAEPMLEVASETLTTLGYIDKVTIEPADARALPLRDNSVDIALAGWVYGHFRYWMPEGWQAMMDQAISEMARVTISGGPMIIIETLGTGVDTPRSSPLDEYYDYLEHQHGFTRQWFRTDYQFDSPKEAADTMANFFGQEMADLVLEHQWARVPECTAIFAKINA